MFVSRLRPSATKDRSIAFEARTRPELERNVLISIPSKMLALIAARTTRESTYTRTAKSCCPKPRLASPSGKLNRAPVDANASTMGIVSSPASSRARFSGMRANRTALTIAEKAATATDTYGGARTSAVITTAGASVR